MIDTKHAHMAAAFEPDFTQEPIENFQRGVGIDLQMQPVS
jgi:hypothetical protein